MGTKTAAAIAAEWKDQARALRNRADKLPGEAVLAGMGREMRGRADVFEECARQLMTDLHTGPAS